MLGIAALNAIPVQGFPILAPQVLDAALTASSRQDYGQVGTAPGDFDPPTSGGRRNDFASAGRGVRTAPTRLARSGELLTALIGQMGGGAMPSGKGIYVDIRV
jgi:hypothetical protein